MTTSPGDQQPAVTVRSRPIRKVLVGQKALVTGANSGIGRAVAVAPGQAGADVVVNYVVRYGNAGATPTHEKPTCRISPPMLSSNGCPPRARSATSTISPRISALSRAAICCRRMLPKLPRPSKRWRSSTGPSPRRSAASSGLDDVSMPPRRRTSAPHEVGRVRDQLSLFGLARNGPIAARHRSPRPHRFQQTPIAS